MATAPPVRENYPNERAYRRAYLQWQNNATGSSNTEVQSDIQPIPTTPTTGTTSEQASAKAVITDTLGQYGLGSLADKAWALYLSGEPIEQVMLEIRDTPEYKIRFPGMADLSAKGQAISEARYIELERGYQSAFRRAGLPEGFYDSPDDFAGYISRNVSVDEMTERLDLARVAAYDTPPQFREELARLYNTDIGGVMAFLLDETKALPTLEKQFAAAQNATAAVLSGYGTLTKDEAERFAYAGRTLDQVQGAFNQLGGQTELFGNMAGEQDAITRGDQLDAALGNNGAVQRRIQKKAEGRVATFQEGGTTQGGRTLGLGTARGA